VRNFPLTGVRILSSIDISNLNFEGFDLSSYTFSPQDILRDAQFQELNRTFDFTLRDFQPLKLFGATQSSPALEYLQIPLPSDDDSFKSANIDSVG
jgi:hypothetical protein